MPIFNAELLLIKDIGNPNNSLMFIIKEILLVVFHIGIIGLIFLRKNPELQKFLIFIPLGFLISFFLNIGVYFFLEPVYFLTLVPFTIIWIICLFQGKGT